MPATLGIVNGEQIKRAREARGLTQRELATAIGVGSGTVSNWERGETVPKNRMGMLREFFGEQNGNGNGDPATMRSDADLLAEAQQILSELSRRALRRTS